MASLDARRILQSLVQGFDPVSGAELPAGTVMQRTEVLGALLEAISALEADAGRTQRRAPAPQNGGRAWSKDEEAQLDSAFRAGEGLPISSCGGSTGGCLTATLPCRPTLRKRSVARVPPECRRSLSSRWELRSIPLDRDFEAAAYVRTSSTRPAAGKARVSCSTPADFPPRRTFSSSWKRCASSSVKVQGAPRRISGYWSRAAVRWGYG